MSNNEEKKPKSKFLSKILRRHSRSLRADSSMDSLSERDTSMRSGISISTSGSMRDLRARSDRGKELNGSGSGSAMDIGTELKDLDCLSAFDDSTLTQDKRLRALSPRVNALDEDSGPEYDLDEMMLDDYLLDDPDHADHSTPFAMLEVDGEKDLQTFFRDLPPDALQFPKYTKVSRKSNKSPKALNHLFLSQELRCSSSDSYESEPTSDPEESGQNSREFLIMEFSRDGKYLAVGGRDSKITVWQVISSPLSRLKYKNHDAMKHGQDDKRKRKQHLNAPVFLQEPVRVFEGHSKAILCLDWSKNNFLVSGSMDKTVKLWNIDRPQCLETFTHPDYVTAVRFHPNDDRFFMSTALDNHIRLWSIMESCVAYSNHLGDDVLATTLTFVPSGETCVVGGFNGTLMAVETQGCNIKTRFDLKGKSRRGGNDPKITGIQIFKSAQASNTGELLGLNMLMSTSDNTIRLIDISRGRLVTRFKGSSNKSSSMSGSVSEDNQLVITGSEDHWCYVWSNNNTIVNNKLRGALKELLRELKSQLSEKHKSLTRILHDNKLWKKLPVQKFLEDSNNHDYIPNDNSSYAAFHAHHSRVNTAIFAPHNTLKLLRFSDDVVFDLVKRGAELSDSAHPPLEEEQLENGYIIVTCDSTGLIRVYRQDPAYYIRKNLIELKKVYKKEFGGNGSNSVNQNIHNLKIDLASLNTRIMKTRSMSPSHESASLRSQFHHKLKAGHRNSLSTLKIHGVYPSRTSTPLRKLSPLATERSSYFSAGRKNDILPIHSTDSSDAEYSHNENASPKIGELRGRNRRGSSLADNDYPHSILSPLVTSHLAMKSVDSLHSKH